jgi:hypothetical protein
MALTRAVITDISHAENSPAQRVVRVLFNPTDYSVDHGSHYAAMPVPGVSTPIQQYIRGEAQVLHLELFLDRTDGNSDIELDLERLRAFVKIDGGLHAPPVARFSWGKFRFEGVVTSLREKFTLFSEDGRVLRARVTLSLKSYKSAEVQLRELKLSSPDRTHVRVLRDGETLAHIAWEVYGDPRMWRAIADANGIRRPRFIPPGTPLRIPTL